jgi:hypothetical protein
MTKGEVSDGWPEEDKEAEMETDDVEFIETKAVATRLCALVLGEA